jgi:peptide/nickel transport system permease protein
VAAFLVRRIAQGLVVVALVATIVFFLIHAAKGDPFASWIDNPLIDERIRAAWRRAYGLDRPLVEQYFRYIANIFRGDLGFSFSHMRPVRHVLADALPNTLLLMSVGLAGAFALGITVAIAQVRRPGRVVDRVLGGISLALFSVPDFWLAMLILATFSLWTGVFPIGGTVDVASYDSYSPAGQVIDRLRHLVLPAASLALLYFPVIARHQRAALLDALPSEYITAARGRGVSERALVRRHALRNALPPIITLIGIAFPALLTGAVFIEKVFSWPGMGYVALGAISTRDYPLLMATVILGGVFVVTGSIIADTLYRVFDPRLRDER